MFKFKRIVIEKNAGNGYSSGLLELGEERSPKYFSKYMTFGYKRGKPLPQAVIMEIIKLATKYNNLLFDDSGIGRIDEYKLYKCFSTALRIFDVIYSSNGNFWIIEDENGDFAGFFYIYDVISLIYPVKKSTYSEIEYVRKPHTATLAGCLKKDFWGVKSKKIFAQILSMLFDCENYKKIKCEIFSSNPYVKGILKRFDFTKEGVLKGETINKGMLENLEIWALFEEKWRRNSIKFEEEIIEYP